VDGIGVLEYEGEPYVDNRGEGAVLEDVDWTTKIHFDLKLENSEQLHDFA
jgi:hypothetical protein